MSSSAYDIIGIRAERDDLLEKAWQECKRRRNGHNTTEGDEEQFKMLAAMIIDGYERSKWANLPPAERAIVVTEIAEGVQHQLEQGDIWRALWNSIPLKVKVVVFGIFVGFPPSSTAGLMKLLGL